MRRKDKIMYKGRIEKGADGIKRIYDKNGKMTGFIQRGADGIERHRNMNGNVTGFQRKNAYGGRDYYNSKGQKKRSTWW